MVGIQVSTYHPRRPYVASLHGLNESQCVASGARAMKYVQELAYMARVSMASCLSEALACGILT